MSVFDQLFSRPAGKGGDSPELVSAPRHMVSRMLPEREDDLQQRTVRTTGFPAIFGYVDTHPKDGYPDSPRAAFGSRYQLVQMLTMRDPDDARWLQDSHQTPPWLRTSPSVREAQRMGLSPASPASPYNVAAWHATTYRGVPSVGGGPGSILIINPQEIVD